MYTSRKSKRCIEFSAALLSVIASKLEAAHRGIDLVSCSARVGPVQFDLHKNFEHRTRHRMCNGQMRHPVKKIAAEYWTSIASCVLVGHQYFRQSGLRSIHCNTNVSGYKMPDSKPPYPVPGHSTASYWRFILRTVLQLKFACRPVCRLSSVKTAVFGAVFQPHKARSKKCSTQTSTTCRTRKRPPLTATTNGA